MEIKNNKRWEKNMKINKLEKSEAFIHPIGVIIKCTQSVNESHLFGFAAIIVAANQR